MQSSGSWNRKSESVAIMLLFSVHDGARNQIADQTVFCRIIIARGGNKRLPWQFVFLVILSMLRCKLVPKLLTLLVESNNAHIHPLPQYSTVQPIGVLSTKQQIRAAYTVRIYLVLLSSLPLEQHKLIRCSTIPPWRRVYKPGSVSTPVRIVVYPSCTGLNIILAKQWYQMLIPANAHCHTIFVWWRSWSLVVGDFL